MQPHNLKTLVRQSVQFPLRLAIDPRVSSLNPTLLLPHTFGPPMSWAMTGFHGGCIFIAFGSPVLAQKTCLSTTAALLRLLSASVKPGESFQVLSRPPRSRAHRLCKLLTWADTLYIRSNIIPNKAVRIFLIGQGSQHGS